MYQYKQDKALPKGIDMTLPYLQTLIAGISSLDALLNFMDTVEHFTPEQKGEIINQLTQYRQHMRDNFRIKFISSCIEYIDAMRQDELIELKRLKELEEEKKKLAADSKMEFYLNRYNTIKIGEITFPVMSTWQGSEHGLLTAMNDSGYTKDLEELRQYLCIDHEIEEIWMPFTKYQYAIDQFKGDKKQGSDGTMWARVQLYPSLRKYKTRSTTTTTDSSSSSDANSPSQQELVPLASDTTTLTS